MLNITLGERVEIKLALSGESCHALVDPNQLTAALVNLAINARDAMPVGGKLAIETRNVVVDQTRSTLDSDIEAGSYVLIAVSDTGVGIPKELITKVFEPFFTTKEVGVGTGLGLSMVHGFVKQSRGHIRLSSEVDQGTTFRIYLPATHQTPKSNTQLPHAELWGGPQTILAVEDNAAVREYIVLQLQSLGYKPLIAADAAEALAIVDSGTAFDLLFTDIIMPGQINGRQLADEVLRRRPLAKVLFTSGHAQNLIGHDGHLGRDVLLLPKPYRREDLARMLRLALTESSATLAS